MNTETTQLALEEAQESMQEIRKLLAAAVQEQEEVLRERPEDYDPRVLLDTCRQMLDLLDQALLPWGDDVESDLRIMFSLLDP